MNPVDLTYIVLFSVIALVNIIGFTGAYFIGKAIK